MFNKKSIVISLLCFFLLTGCGSYTEECIDDTQLYENESEMHSDLKESDKSVEDSSIEPSEESSCVNEAENSLIYVFVCGAVNSPGVYGLEKGSRVYEAIEMAGGISTEADSDYLNQAEILTDGQRVRVYTCEETKEENIFLQEHTSETVEGSSVNSKININSAGINELTTLSGIGESKARAIIAYRESNGKFSSIEEIKNVNGIKESVFNSIKDNIII